MCGVQLLLPPFASAQSAFGIRPGAPMISPAPASGASVVAQAQAQAVAQATAPSQTPQFPAAPSGQPAPAAAGPARVLSLDDALGLAEAKNEQIAIAQAGVTRAEGGEMRAKSELYPQVSASASYDRTLASEFAGIFDSTGPSCTPLTVNPAAPIEDRLREIERALQECPPSGDPFGQGGGGGTGDGGDEGDGGNPIPFGQPNAVRFTFSFSQNVYSGGRIGAQRDQARLTRTNADLTLTTTRAQLSFDVAQAYYDSALSDRLVLIAEETLAQADRTYEQTRAQREAGRQAEFDLLRAQVSRDTQKPEVIRRRNARDLAYLRLKQLLDLPLEQQLQLTTKLDEEVLQAPAQRFVEAIANMEAGGASPRERTAVTQVANDVQSREADVRIARSQRMPVVSLTSSYGNSAYPSSFSNWNGGLRQNATVGVAMSLPLFTGWRIRADEIMARADVAETEARLQLSRELATLDDASARLDVSAARASFEASAGTVQQAQRAYEIAELRYREGLSTQLELSDARLLLQQAQANRAQAARDVQVARVRLALLPDLPLTTTGAATPQPGQAGAGAQGGQTQRQPATPAPGTQTPGTTGAPGAPGATGTGATGAQPR